MHQLGFFLPIPHLTKRSPPCKIEMPILFSAEARLLIAQQPGFLLLRLCFVCASARLLATGLEPRHYPISLCSLTAIYGAMAVTAVFVVGGFRRRSPYIILS